MTFKPVRSLRLSVQIPDGQVKLVVPIATSLETAHAFALAKLPWIRTKRQALPHWESPPQFITGECHHLWGEPYHLKVLEQTEKPSVRLESGVIILSIRPGSDVQKRAQVFYRWQRAVLHAVVPALIERWEARLSVQVKRYFLQRLKTRWGSCNPRLAHIRLNTELVKRPQDLLEYVVVHELAHLIVPNHGPGFTALLDQHHPFWREAQARLSQLSPTFFR